VRSLQRDKEASDLINAAVRLSSNVIAKDPVQFASQMVGRLLPYEDMPTINEFMKRIGVGTRSAWLRPIRPVLHPPGTPLVRTLEGHSSVVEGVVVTPDGRLAVSSSDDKTLKVWDLETGRELRTLEGHSSVVESVVVTPDGRRVVSASHDKTLKVWDLETGLELCTLKGQSKWISGVAMSPDGRYVVSASYDKTLKVWDLERGRAQRTLKGHSNEVYAVAVTPDGRRAISTSYDQTLKVWDLETGRAPRILEGHSNCVTGVAASFDQQRVVSASSDQTLKVWDLETGRELRTLRLMGKKLLVALTMEGKFAGEGLQTMDEDDDMLSAMARELVEKNGIGETADNVWRALTREHQKLFPTSSNVPSVAQRCCQRARYAHIGLRTSSVDRGCDRHRSGSRIRAEIRGAAQPQPQARRYSRAAILVWSNTIAERQISILTYT
jgi:WD domain, G-beta repeat